MGLSIVLRNRLGWSCDCFVKDEDDHEAGPGGRVGATSTSGLASTPIVGSWAPQSDAASDARGGRDTFADLLSDAPDTKRWMRVPNSCGNHHGVQNCHGESQWPGGQAPAGNPTELLRAWPRVAGLKGDAWMKPVGTADLTTPPSMKRICHVVAPLGTCTLGSDVSCPETGATPGPLSLSPMPVLG